MKNETDKQDRILYHYCSNETMFNIVKSGQLRMTDIARSNDYDEMKILHPRIFYALESIYVSNRFPFKYKEKKDYDAIKELLRDTNNNIDEKRKRGDFTSFVVCFSEAEDSLSQWRGYANNAKGCSAGFSLNELKQYCQKHENVITVQRIEYISKNQATKIAEKDAIGLLQLIKELRPDAEKALEKKHHITVEMIDEFMLFSFSNIVNRLLIDSLKYKWDSFSEEKEWRMYFKGITKNENELFADAEKGSFIEWQMSVFREIKILHGKVDLFPKEDCLIPFYPIDMRELSDTPIKSLIIGSKNKTYIQDYKMLFVREKMGMPDIKYSRITYR